MTKEVVKRDEALTPERIDRGLEWLRHSLPSLRDDPETRKRAAAAVSALSEPAHPAKTMARVLALLSPYYDKDTPQMVRQMEADDWAEALGEYPYWAIERACRWWKSGANEYRRRRPLEGDIVARCRVEMQVVRAAQITLDAKPREGGQREEREPVSDEARAEMRRRMAEAGNSVVAKMRARAGK
jgi:hypothetical protein